MPIAKAKKPASTVPADKLTLYETLVATVPGVERKGDTMPYTSLNGYMFSYLSKEGPLVLRLPAEAREAFMKKYKTTLHTAYGIVQKEYVDVPDSLLKKTKELQPYFQASHDYVKGLKPKATTKPRKTK
jgi:hypothetical protein